VPREVLDRRDKIGFAAPQARWLARAGEEVRQLLLPDGQLIERGWMSRRDVARAVASAGRSRSASELMWRMFILEAWLRQAWPTGRRSVEAASLEARPAAPVAGL
jgi:hypothetical protein